MKPYCKSLFFTFLSLFFIAASLGLATSPPRVVVSIPPFHSLVAAVMEGVATPTLLFSGKQSPHVPALRPSAIQALHKADLVVWVGPELEVGLVRPMETLPSSVHQLRLLKLPKLTLYPLRQGDHWEAHTHEGGHSHEHDNTAQDPHIWLSPLNARLIMQTVCEWLVKYDPEHAEQYQKNYLKALKKLEKLDALLKTKLQNVASKPFLVFHDGYQYFERHYDLKGVGAMTLDPETFISLHRLEELKKVVQVHGVGCIFAEIQFKADLIHTFAVRTGLKVGYLDPLGGSLPEDIPASELYFALLNHLADQFVQGLMDKNEKN